MVSVSSKYTLSLIKKTAKLEPAHLKSFVMKTLKSFGGTALLSNLAVSIKDGVIEMSADKENMMIAEAALLYCGEYHEMPCKFVNIDSYN
ncbi:hypothetical protein ENBRE01_2686 [Enteropsectra breve]|nr:hypothetical protein ENBRE01_2686 [Enteropsectra breve]